jgi:hypothetical protein
MHIRGLGKQVDLGDQLLTARIAGASAEQHGEDAYGKVEYSSYLTPDTRLTRHLVLTAEGYLIVHDVLVPGKSMADWNAGQLWQLYEKQASGDDWFCSEDDGPYPTSGEAGAATNARRMLVRHDTSHSTAVGIEEIRQECHDGSPRGRKPVHFWTTFSHRKVTPGEPEGFTMAVVPHDPRNGDPAALARRIRFHTEANRTKIMIAGDEKANAVEVTIDAKGWQVTR